MENDDGNSNSQKDQTSFCIDNDGEYKNYPFTYICEERMNLHHNRIGVVERMNRMLLEKVQCILSNAGLGKDFGLRL